MIPLPIYVFLLIELIFVSYGDVKTEKIPNMWSVINLFAFIVLLIITPQFYQLELQTFAYSFVFLIIGFLLFLLKVMGGGDSKFLFTFFLLVPVSLQELTLTYLLYSTMLIGGFFFLTNLAKNFDQIIRSLRIKDLKGVKSYFGTKFSFAPVILLTWLWIGLSLKDKFNF